MIFLDTNVPIYASDSASPFCSWARETIAAAVAGDGAVTNAVCLAELCVGAEDPGLVADQLRSWGIQILDLPAAAAELCAVAYRHYRSHRSSEAGATPPRVPLPDFFIGAHCALMGWDLATGDEGRFRTYFPQVRLLTP